VPISSFATKLSAAAIVAIALAAGSVGANAEDGRTPVWLTATYGNGDRVDIYGVGVMWAPSWGSQRFTQRGFEWRFAADVNYWIGPSNAASDRTLWDVGFTPFLRWNPGDETFSRMFVEAGIGPHLLSQTRIGVGPERSRVFSTAFQFGSRLAVGVKLGDKQQYELAAYVQHDSNASIKTPNSGLTYFGAVLRVPLEFP
jgi:lipid A 3-O-deacylase